MRTCLIAIEIAIVGGIVDFLSREDYRQILESNFPVTLRANNEDERKPSLRSPIAVSPEPAASGSSRRGNLLKVVERNH